MPRRRGYRRRPAGHQQAIEHIQAAHALSRELGGTDADVKEYFFSLAQDDLSRVFDEYELQFGGEARRYAEYAFPKWKSGRTSMSGLVAGRLFALLPKRMPLAAKYSLVETLWKHIGPKSYKFFYVGYDADHDEVTDVVQRHFESVATPYHLPDGMQKRFDWLSGGDVGVKQELLNHLQNQETALVAMALRQQLTVLANYLRSGKSQITASASQVLTVGEHEVRLIFSDSIEGITETAPRPKVENAQSGGCAVILWLGVGFTAACAASIFLMVRAG